MADKVDLMEAHQPVHTQQLCETRLIAIRGALAVLNGKWKLPIILSLSFGNKRFRELAREIDGVTDKMLSKELKDLEVNQLVKRTVYDTFPPTVEYSITDYGRTLRKAIDELGNWGLEHRKRIMKKG